MNNKNFLFSNFLKFFSNEKNYRYMRHNKKNFKFDTLNTNKKILIEFHNWSSLHIAGSYLLKCLQKKYKANIFAYAGYPLTNRPLERNLYEKIKWYVGIFLSYRYFGIYKSLGVKKFIYPDINKSLKLLGIKKFESIIKKIKNNRDIEKIKINGVVIGDLIYDSYLRIKFKETIIVNDLDFQEYLKESVQLFLYWDEYFNKNKIQAIILSHSVYFLGMFARIALKKRIKVYVCHPDYINCLNKKIPYARAEFLDAKNILKKVDKIVLKKGLEYSKKRIKKHISGKKIDIWWTKKSIFKGKKYSRVLNKNGKFKFLIASHSFIDSPHAFGNNLFPDNYLWLEFIAKSTINSKNEYYLKSHPGLYAFEKKHNKKIINNLIIKYPHIKLLPDDVGHFQLIKEGINCVLTVIGTIGFEYPLFNIPVINASMKSATSQFNFNLHINSINHYKSLILKPKNIKLDINKNEILKYFFLRHIYHPRNWLFKNIQNAEQQHGVYSPNIYDYWLNKEYSEKRDKKILENLSKFINSNEYILNYKYMDRDMFEDMSKL